MLLRLPLIDVQAALAETEKVSEPQQIPLIQTPALTLTKEKEVILSETFFFDLAEYEETWTTILPFKLPNVKVGTPVEKPKNFRFFSVLGRKEEEMTISSSLLVQNIFTNRSNSPRSSQSFLTADTLDLDETLQYGELSRWDSKEPTSESTLPSSLEAASDHKSAQTTEPIDFKPRSFLVKSSQPAS